MQKAVWHTFLSESHGGLNSKCLFLPLVSCALFCNLTLKYFFLSVVLKLLVKKKHSCLRAMLRCILSRGPSRTEFADTRYRATMMYIIVCFSSTFVKSRNISEVRPAGGV